MVTIEQKYEAAKRLLNAQIDALVKFVDHDLGKVVQVATSTKGFMFNWVNASPENKEAYEALGTELIEVTSAELKEAMRKQGYQNV